MTPAEIEQLSAEELVVKQAQEHLHHAAQRHDEALAEYYVAWAELERVRQRFDMINKI